MAWLVPQKALKKVTTDRQKKDVKKEVASKKDTKENKKTIIKVQEIVYKTTDKNIYFVNCLFVSFRLLTLKKSSIYNLLEVLIL